MASISTDIPPFHISPLLSNIWYSPDLLDFSQPGKSSAARASTNTHSSIGSAVPTSQNESPQPASSSIFASASSIAAAAGRRAVAAASAASPVGSPATGRTASPDRSAVRSDLTSGDPKVSVMCVEGYGDNLYVGRSDGVVEWWVCDGSPGASKHNGWTARHRHTLFPRRPVSKIVLLPKLGRAFVLSEGTLHPLSLPSLEPVPSTVIQPLRGVVSVILDDDELEWGGVGAEEKGAEMTVVVVRRKGLGIYRLGQRLVTQNEIPLPSAPTSHALSSNFLCIALPSSATYALIDLSDASLTEVLPVSQIDQSELDFTPNPNVVVIPGENEFLVTSYTGVSTMGVFLNGQGDPVRGTMEWPDHPISITIDSGFIIALLRNDTIHIHSLGDLDKPVQVMNLDPAFNARALSYSPYGISMRNVLRDQRMSSSSLLLLGGVLAPPGSTVQTSSSPEVSTSIQPSTNTAPDGPSPTTEEPPSGSGLTPPSSPPTFSRQPIAPTRSSSLLRLDPKSAMGPFSTAIAETLAIGPNGIQSLFPTPVILRVEQLCAQRRMEDAIKEVDEERRKGRRGEIEGDKMAHSATMRFLHLYLGLHLMMETMFEKAGDYLLRAKVDPRLVVRLFPKLRGKVIGSAEEVDVLDGVKTVLEAMPPIEEIVSASVKRNYSPHASPSTSEAPETIELSKALYEDAKSMLTEILRKTRQSRRKGGGGRGVDSRKIDIVIDTTLAKLLADAGTTNELLALLAAPNDAVLSELEPFLEKRPYVLATVMRQQGKSARVLQILKDIAESADGDPLCSDPVDEIAQQLETVSDPDLFRQYTLWLVGRDPNAGLSLLLNNNAKTGIKLDDETLITDLHNIDKDAANRYLEHVVVVKRSANRSLHESLLDQLIHQVGAQIQDDGVRYHLEELDAEYRLSADSQPFPIFLADIAPATPIKALRLKLMLFLQGSPFYDTSKVVDRLEAMVQLKTELAIVLGKQGKNKKALRLLAKDIGDFVSAQLYCTQGGEIMPPKIAHLIAGHVPELVDWATLGDVGRRRRGTVDAKTQEGLVMDLLGVYMQDGANTAKQAASLLNAQSVHMDVLDVLKLVPDEWPLDVVSTFFQRGLRRELHGRASWQILKSISAGQNLQTSIDYLDAVSKIPPVVIQPPSHASSAMALSPDEGSIPEKEGGPGGDDDEKAKETYTTVSGEGRMEEKEGDNNGFFSPEVIKKELAHLSVNDRNGANHVESLR